MPLDFAAFHPLVAAVLHRFYEQNDRPAPAPAELLAIAARLWQLIEERHPLHPSDGELSAADAQACTARVLAHSTDELLAIAARQLVKTCLQPSPAACRNSFRETGADGHCRRQDAARARLRVSGSHCVDCPYWQELDAEDHAVFLAQHWQSGDASEFTSHRELFLPEDYRALRRAVLAPR
ncbi:hypothetical protein K0B96_01435 [Horticoccus luteus]|uniref:Uncharacterized protein n=1 Tax=Horticoccus luteus TaxID=2862869 RepID=A0A8F9TWV6_9BACT|nr:hypothetical protein [Horticoccus luteus]QYM79309.1 hypothetical protein K0B96_01435 [Horticoccus luteus]